MAENLIYATKENLKRVSDNMKVYVDSDKTVSIKGYLKINNTWNFYNTTTPTEETTPIFSIDIPAEYFLDQTKTSFVQEFAWSDDLYTGSTNPNLDGKPVFVMAVKGDDNTVTYSFVNVERLIDIYTGENTKSISLTVGEDNKITANVNISEAEGNILAVKDDGIYATVEGIFKTYKSLDELGLTAPVKVKDIVSAMEIGTEAYIDCTDVSSIVTDLPENGTMPCEVYIRKHFSGMIHVEAILANTRYLGDDGGTAYTWEKVATTNWVSSLVNNPYEYVYDTTIYGADILKYPLGHYKIGNNSTIADFTNLPVNTPGMLDVMCPTTGGNQSPWESQYGYRYYRYTTYRGGTYERTLASGATAGNITEDTGWKKIAYNGDSLSLNGLELSSGARISIHGSASGAGTLIDGEYFTVDNANTGKSSTITTDSIDTPEVTTKKVTMNDGTITMSGTGLSSSIAIKDDYLTASLYADGLYIEDDDTNENTHVGANGISTPSYNGQRINNEGFVYGNRTDDGNETLYGNNCINSINESNAYFGLNLWSNGGAIDHNAYSFQSDSFFAELYTGQPDLGNANAKWKDIYAETSTISTSDRNKKTDITPLNENIKEFVMGLNPLSYKLINGTSDRKHYGLVAQDVEELMTTLGMDSKDFAGFIKSPKYVTREEEYTVEPDNEDEEPIVKTRRVKELVQGENVYSLRYEEFIAPIIKTVQMQQQEINELRSSVEELRAKIK